MLPTHLLIVDVLSCLNMEWYDDEPMVHVYYFCLFRLGRTSILILLIH
jgi:phage terminase large subunit-like protein